MKKIQVSVAEILKKNRLFKEIDEKDYKDLLSMNMHTLTSLKPNEELNVTNSLVIVIDGALEAYKNEYGKKIFLKRVSPSEITGIATLFDKSGQYISTLLAKKESTLLMLSEGFVLSLLRTSPIFAETFSRLLCEKLRYLNSRIDTYTQTTADEKLFEFIKSSAKIGDNYPFIEMSMSSLSSALGIGRASLYRAISTLEERDIISKDGKKIYLMKRG